jgi:hypothetical protein
VWTLQGSLGSVASSLSTLKAEQEAAMVALRADVAAYKATRDADLEVIERAFTVAHENHESVCLYQLLNDIFHAYLGLPSHSFVFCDKQQIKLNQGRLPTRHDVLHRCDFVLLSAFLHLFYVSWAGVQCGELWLYELLFGVNSLILSSHYVRFPIIFKELL